ncbi:Flp pilus assembly protein CpaB [Moritella sp. PE36]|uniref:Flp pilus assembly protein CpaB n=1 Tax=Moritella sp. PE36 TaxID=58051 RepID=UPI00015692D1|nr:Flp pilus assembly protein CpaB [Moritella sp. PE36]EDM64951.1 Flp pilus assembly protein CpaB [Moritella sp. PE36]
MNAKRLVYLSVCMSLLGLIWLFFSLSAPVNSTPKQDTVKTYEVLVSTQDVVIGRPYSASLFAWKTVDESSVRDRIDFIDKANFSIQALKNTVAAADFVTGQILSPSDFLKPEQGGFLSVMLRPNYRAVSIPVDEVTANSGLIGPGDHVDVLLLASKSQELRSRGNETQSLYVKTIAQNVRVLAFNDALQLARYMEKQKHNKGVIPDNSTVTLEVSPLQANQITLANQLGTLSMVLRSKNSQETDSAVIPAVNVDDILPAIKQVQPDIGLVEFRAKNKRVMNNAGSEND